MMLQATARSPQQSATGENMAHALLVNTITNSFPSPNLLNDPGKPYYASIWYTHCLLTANAVSIKFPRGVGQKVHLGIVLMATQYVLVVQVPFVRLTNPGQTTTIPVCTSPFDEKKLIRENAEQRQQCNECHNVEVALRNQLLTASKDIYLSPLNHTFMGYSRTTTVLLLSHLYGYYARILATDLTENDTKLNGAFNPNELLESLYTRISECVY